MNRREQEESSFIIDILVMIFCETLKMFFYGIYKKSMMLRYILKGKSKKSFLYHGIALCYGQIEYNPDNDDSPAPSIEDIATWDIDDYGNGTLWAKDYTLTTNAKGETKLIISKTNIIDTNYKTFAEDYCNQKTNADEGISYQVVCESLGKYTLLITYILDANPAKFGARHHITEALEDILSLKQYEFVAAYNKYKSEQMKART